MMTTMRKRFMAVGCAAVLACCLTAGLVGCSCSGEVAKKESGQTEQKKTEPKQPEKKQDDKKAVPNVVGMTKDDAQRVVADAGFKVGAVTEEESETVAAGMVVKQTPDVKTEVAAGTSIDLVVSKGVQKPPEQVAVPDLTGMTQTQAEDALAKAKLVSKAEDPVYKGDVDPGRIFSQSVAAGTKADAGTTVSFTVALGKEVAAVPSVIGKARDAAVAALTDAGFNVDVVEAYHASAAAGTVSSQNPNPKIQCVKGTTVTLLVSKGPAPSPKEQVPVPDLATLSLPQAQDVLASAGLVCKFTGNEDGYVVAQSIVAGTNVDRGATVTVTLEEPYTQGATEGEATL
ncbi:PASTA domain-containing protein [Arabiibacter massiliensis]|uniref:PASTA domain-containing protein n=1 Tax=Arabiibacter massiliensis TaxID=1870985 RepID=UPI0009B93510|nr:PASTA domain-containing protein [Arabiibacter massiliensis]